MQALKIQKNSKHAHKKRELLASAIATLSQLGYAHTSLRDIAKQSGVSLGVIHYYFEDKSDLIKHCVQAYKIEFLGRLQQVTTDATSYNELVEGFCHQMALAIEKDANLHRLWYDIRSQALFDSEFHHIIQELEEAMIELAAVLLARMRSLGGDTRHFTAISFYLMLDSQFRYWLQQKLCYEKKEAPEKLKQSLLDTLFTGINCCK